MVARYSGIDVKHPVVMFMKFYNVTRPTMMKVLKRLYDEKRLKIYIDADTMRKEYMVL